VPPLVAVTTLAQVVEQGAIPAEKGHQPIGQSIIQIPGTRRPSSTWGIQDSTGGVWGCHQAAKNQHWKDFLEEITGMELWVAHWYVTSPAGDGSKARIPTLQVAEEHGSTRDIASNEEKGTVLCRMFLPSQAGWIVGAARHGLPARVN